MNGIGRRLSGRFERDFSRQESLQFRVLSGHFAVDFPKFLAFAAWIERYARSWTDYQQLLRFRRVADDHPGVRLADTYPYEPAPAALPKVDERFVFAPSNGLHCEKWVDSGIDAFRGPRGSEA
jgi:hypothetical protein